MKPNKEEILEVLKTIYFDNQKIDIVSDNAVLNILVFDKEIIIDLNTNNPSLQGKNKIKLKILNSIQNMFSEDIDVEAEIKKIEEELKYTKGFLISVSKKLSNERFVSNAPEQVVAVEKKKMADAEAKVKILEEKLNAFA